MWLLTATIPGDVLFAIHDEIKMSTLVVPSMILWDDRLIFQGLLDSEYNTDNAWLEGFIFSYHDAYDNAFRYISLPESSKYRSVRHRS